MKFDVDELYYRIRNDHRFKKRLRTLVIIGGAAVVLTVVIAVIGAVFFSSVIISFVFSYAPALYEVAFSTVRDFSSSLVLDELTAALNPLTGGIHVQEMKNLIKQYFDQLISHPAIDYQNFQNFYTTVKNSLSDGQITTAELETVKQFILKN